MENSIKSQNQAIRDHLESGKAITPIDALQQHNCFRLGARIYDLKDSGMNIITEMVKRGKKRFASYKLQPTHA